jgi:glucose-6-phosphate isomerase
MQNKFTHLPEFKDLQAQQKTLAGTSLHDLFTSDAKRFEHFSISLPGLLLDYSRHHINQDSIQLLCDLARAQNIDGWRDKMFAGEPINNSEHRAVLHTALRGSVSADLAIDGENVTGFVNKTLAQMEAFCNTVRGQKKITDIVSIGIGGSDLGARTVAEALRPFHNGPALHFVANIDGAVIAPLLARLNPDTTLFVIISKTFTTLETMTNAHTAKDWLVAARGMSAISSHFVAVTENIKGAEALGIHPNHIFPLRVWIGGRTGVWSSAGLPVALAIGFKKFKELLRGAHAMDVHFRDTPLEHNMPVIMALLGVWYRNFWNYSGHAILPYLENLKIFTTYMQQLDMESNGKSVTRDGAAVDYKTGGIVFGEPGTNAQHAFFQLLHQGTEIIPSDFIIAAKPEHELTHHHQLLNANALAQAKGLMNGFESRSEPHRHYPGNRPSSMIVLDRLDPYHLGLLLALYEHKIFVQGVLWNINPFDQWGVELGKTISQDMVQALENKGEISPHLDSSAAALVAYLHARG